MASRIGFYFQMNCLATGIKKLQIYNGFLKNQRCIASTTDMCCEQMGRVKSWMVQYWQNVMGKSD